MGRAGSVIRGMRPGAVKRNSAMMAYWIACMAYGSETSGPDVPDNNVLTRADLEDLPVSNDGRFLYTLLLSLIVLSELFEHECCSGTYNSSPRSDAW